MKSSDRPPTFIIGGAPRSGTTWLYHMLDRHPGIHMASPVRPEPKFFLVDEEYVRGAEHYRRTWFSDVPDGAITGEKSTNYLESPTAAARIAASVPHTRLIFSLREPAERALSNYRWSRQNGLEDLDFETALELEPIRETPRRLRYARPHAYFSRGLYAQHLTAYFERFDRDRILVLRFEDLVEAPEAVARRTHHFLGVDERPRDVEGLARMNTSQPTDRDLRRVMEALRRRFREPNAALAELLGPVFEVWGESR